MPNPFKPTAGKMPPILIGRQSIVDDFSEALVNGAGAPGRLMLITGQRGFGKTVMLTELAKTALEEGWEVYSETASAGMADRFVTALESKVRVSAASIAPSVSVSGFASMQLGGISVSGPQAALTLRAAINAKLKKIPRGKGVLFTVDEAQAARGEELVALATALQHVMSDQDLSDMPDSSKKGVAFAFAGLPSVVDEVVNNQVLTFLRRAMLYELGNVPLPDVRNAFMQSVAESGKEISRECADKASLATGGNPYLVQLVGYYMWQAAQARCSRQIEPEDVSQGIQDAQDQFPRAVCVPIYQNLTSAQQRFLRAMASDFPEASTLSDIAERAGKSMSWVGKYRTSLERARIIRTADWGMVAYDVPYLGSWIAREFGNGE